MIQNLICFFCKCLDPRWTYVYDAAKNIIIRSKHNKFTPRFHDRMSLNESKHTPTVCDCVFSRNTTARECGFNKIPTIFKNRAPSDIPKRRNACHMRSRRNRFRGVDRSQVRGPFSDPEILASSRVDRGRRFLRKFSIVRSSNLWIVDIE